MDKEQNTIQIAIAWCLAWGTSSKPQVSLEILRQMRTAMLSGGNLPEAAKKYVEQAQKLHTLPFPKTLDELKALVEKNSDLWDSKLGLVYGGATKIKQYVFEASKLPDIRGASALLDRINLVDLPAFFGKSKSITVEQWLDRNFPGREDLPKLRDALIPELIIYSTGGNILAFCPAAFVDDLADAIEKRYTEETLTANSCAVGDKFRPLELCFGLLQDNIEDAHWLDWYRKNRDKYLVKAYYAQPDVNDPEQEFRDRKSFNELAGKLASLFNQRRNGNNVGDRSTTRRYPVMFETHPYLVRDQNDRCSAIGIPEPPDVPSKAKLSEALARKKVIGQIAKREYYQDNLPKWFKELNLEWQPTGISIKSWVTEFEDYLQKEENQALKDQYFSSHKTPEEARSLREIGNVSHPKGFVAYIYADGNNMGGYIQKIKTSQEYQKFSRDIFDATEHSVYKALAKHLKPREIKGLTGEDSEQRDGWIHPFEILTIGGDDVMLIVPADQALAIAQTIGEEFENILLSKGDRYRIKDPSILQKSTQCHRYTGESAEPSSSKLSMSAGVLITAEDTPIYYAQDLAEQLLKSAKKKAKDLKAKHEYQYHGGTIDFLVMKSVTMISSNISEFRKQGLTKYITGEQKQQRQQTLKLYAAPYTLHEIGGLLKTLEALKNVDFPRSQLYQIRSLLEQGKNTAILNYRYFRCRLKQGKDDLEQHFEDAWCKAKTNDGNLAPWMSLVDEEKANKTSNKEKVDYETIWRELVDLYPFILDIDEKATDKQPSQASSGDKP